MKIPAISVVMGVYNGEEYLEEAVCSILNQTFTDFELIIVDDASTDDTPNILTRLAAEDPRILILTNTENKKLPFVRNKSIHAARAPYVTFMDADDWSYPERLAKQYAFMETHPHVSLCGIQAEEYETGNHVRARPCSDAEIRVGLFFHCFITYPLLRKKLAMERTQGFDESMVNAEDYDLWVRLAEHDDIIFASLAETLFRYRTSPNKNRTAYYALQHKTCSNIHFRQQQRLGIAKPDKDMHNMLTLAPRINDPQKLHLCGQWMQDVLKANEQKKLYNSEMFRNELSKRWLRLCRRSFPYTLTAINIYKQYTPKPDTWFLDMAKAIFKSSTKLLR